MIQTEKKCVFAVINLVNTEGQMKNTIMYAANLAKKLNLVLILHPKHEESNYPFAAGGDLLAAMARNMKVACKISQYAPSFFTSINAVANKQNAAFMVIGVSGKLTKKEHKKEFSQTMWEVANRTNVPNFLVSKETVFDPFSEITIAVDSSRNIQKVNFLELLTNKETIVNLFIENTDNVLKQKKIDMTLLQIERYLSRHDISYKKEVARESKDYTQHLLKFAAKKSKLLLIEVESSLDTDLKENLEKVLFGKHQQFAVLLIRTKDVTLSSWR